MRKKILNELKVYLKVLIFSAIIILGTNYILAWTDAPANPPTCPSGYPGCDAPLHVGSAPQSKAGPLALGTSNQPASNLTLDIRGNASDPQGNAGIAGTLFTIGLNVGPTGGSQPGQLLMAIDNNGQVGWRWATPTLLACSASYWAQYNPGWNPHGWATGDCSSAGYPVTGCVGFIGGYSGDGGVMAAVVGDPGAQMTVGNATLSNANTLGSGRYSFSYYTYANGGADVYISNTATNPALWVRGIYYCPAGVMPASSATGVGTLTGTLPSSSPNTHSAGSSGGGGGGKYLN